MILRPVLYASWGEMLRSRGRLLLLASLSVPSFIGAAFTHATSPAASGRGALCAIILGAGLIGRPIANGTLALVFSRPVRRSSYVLTRWLAAWSSAAALAIACNVILALEATRYAQIDWAALGVASVEDILGAAGAAAVLVFLSCIARGFGDAVLMVGLLMSSAILEKLGQFLSKPLLSRVAVQVSEFVTPKLDVITVFRSTPVSWYAVTAYLSTVALCLAAAIELVNRTEISYSSAGE